LQEKYLIANLTYSNKSIFRKMIIGHKLDGFRESSGLLFRQFAAELEADTAYIRKMVRGEKNINKDSSC